MVIERDGNGITVKTRPDSPAYVRVGVTRTSYQVGDRLEHMSLGQHKPHDEYTVGDCRALLDRLEQFARQRGYTV